MEIELKDLKSVLRSIVVSSPAQVDVRSLQRDYKNMMGSPIPLAKFGYRDVLTFLKERCADCFLFQGMPSNPVLTLIVPDSLKHIDQFVQKQKSSAVTKIKGKRRSVQESCSRPPNDSHLIYKTFNRHNASGQSFNNIRPEAKHELYSDKKETTENANSKRTDKTKNNSRTTESTLNGKSDGEDAKSHTRSEESGSVRDFLKKRLPMYDSSQYLNGEVRAELDEGSSKEDDDSGRQTSSSRNSEKLARWEELQREIHALIREHEDGVPCTDIVRLYRERYARELHPERFGHSNIGGLLGAMRALVAVGPGGRVRDAARPAPAAPRAPRAPPRVAVAASAPPVDPDDALPGIDFDPDVFPPDCVHFLESIPPLDLSDVGAGAMLEVVVGEVYSPSHFWLQRLGPRHGLALDELMDEMAAYYAGEGRERALARGAVRAGHYCAALYERDWHRALIVRVVDADTVKVRHVDYGTVDAVPAAALKPLLRRWARLPAQALRARLAGLRPGAGGRRWPRAAAAHFLHLVRDRRFVANVVAVDPEEDAVETFLIDTSGAEDACVTSELIRAGHADPRPDSALRTGECYLYPRFEALESGATPNFAEIHRYLADGIDLEYVDAYRRHVPAALPEPAPPAPPPLVRPPARSPAPPPASSPVAPSPRATPAAPSPAPVMSAPPPPPAPWLAPPRFAAPAPWGEVRLSLQECEMYSLLSALDPEAAHCYMLSALRRAAAARAPVPLNPLAPPFRAAYPPASPASPALLVGLRPPPPPGF